MNISIRYKVILIFLGFLGLVSGSVYATSLALESQSLNINLVDLAVHQRKEVNIIARSVISLQTETRQNVYYLNLLELDQAVDDMGNSLDVLLYGGTITSKSTERIITIPETKDEETIEILLNLNTRWESVREATNILVSGGGTTEKSRAATEIETQIPLLITRIDELTKLLQLSAANNLYALRSIQATFFFGAILLLVWGYFIVRNNILIPLSKLNSASQKIASGNLQDSIKLNQRDEVGVLADSFETMRREIALSRQRAESWAEELESTVNQRTKELTALLDISADISSHIEVEGVLKSVVDTARELFQGKVSVLCLLNHSANSLTVASTSGAKHALERTEATVNTKLLSDVLNRGKTVTHGACSECPILSETYLEEAVVAPMKIKGEAMGAICVADVDADIGNESSESMLTFLANSAANALENARLYDSSQSAAALAERERLAADMHDGLAQMLGYLNLKADQAVGSLADENIAEANEQLLMMQPAIQNAYDTVRKALVGLRDDGLSQTGLEDQLRSSLTDFEEKCDVETVLSLDEEVIALVSEEEQIQLLRIAQESLTNVRKHSEASEVVLSLSRDGNMVELNISDNGIGFDPAIPKEDDTPHLGLKIMRGRVERVVGSLTIQSQVDRGTQVIARIPISDSEQELDLAAVANNSDGKN